MIAESYDLIGITRAVKPLVMEMCHVFRNVQELLVSCIRQHFVNDSGAFRSVGLHLFEFFRRKSAGLPQDHVIHRDLSQIMHGRGFYDLFTEPLRQVKSTGLPDGIHQKAYPCNAKMPAVFSSTSFFSSTL